jgi:hypothetical protein
MFSGRGKIYFDMNVNDFLINKPRDFFRSDVTRTHIRAIQVTFPLPTLLKSLLEA